MSRVIAINLTYMLCTCGRRTVRISHKEDAVFNGERVNLNVSMDRKRTVRVVVGRARVVLFMAVDCGRGQTVGWGTYVCTPGEQKIGGVQGLRRHAVGFKAG